MPDIDDATKERTCHERQQRCTRSRSRQSRCPTQGETKEHYVASHIRCKHVSQRDKTHSVNKPRTKCEGHQRNHRCATGGHSGLHGTWFFGHHPFTNSPPLRTL